MVFPIQVRVVIALACTVCTFRSDSASVILQSTGRRLDSGGSSPIIALAFDGTGKRLAVGAEHDLLTLWDVASGQLIKTMDRGLSGQERWPSAEISFTYRLDHSRSMSAFRRGITPTRARRTIAGCRL